MIMLSDLQKLSDGLIIYSAHISDFEKLDFKSDALAGVRANFFNSNHTPQSDKNDLFSENQNYSLSYTMRDGEPLLWKVMSNNQQYQKVQRNSGDVYCVLTYGENGTVCKRMYFDNFHNWLATEYFDNEHENRLLATVKPVTLNEVLCIKYEKISSYGDKTMEYLYPSATPPAKKSAGLVYSNCGMIWFDKVFKPEETEEVSNQEHRVQGFDFTVEDFTKPAVNPLDLFNADYLTKADYMGEEDYEQPEPEIEEEPEKNGEYSAYDKIEKILYEAHKTNKNIFGVVVSQSDEAHAEGESVAEEEEKSNAEPEQAEENTAQTEGISDETRDAADKLEIIAEELSNDDEYETEEIADKLEMIADIISEEAPEESAESENTAQTEEAPEESAESEDTAQTEEASAESAPTPKYEVREKQRPDSTVKTKKGDYSYYGKVDKYGRRTGIGRTASPEGLTVYEGNYVLDKRDGFGISYYRDGLPNYVGAWENGNRSGCGVGYRHSDGTLHVGNWTDNTPDGIGARFGKNGGFLDVCSYSEGTRHGKAVSFDENGNVVIVVYKDGEAIAAKIIGDADLASDA